MSEKDEKNVKKLNKGPGGDRASKIVGEKAKDTKGTIKKLTTRYLIKYKT